LTMNTDSIRISGSLSHPGRLIPGILLAAAVAVAAVLSAPLVAKAMPIPAMVIALLFGIVLNGVANRPVFQPGLAFCVRTLLRWAVALLGLRIALGDIFALGFATALVVMVSMLATIIAGFVFARLLGQSMFYGALAGASTAVCGASAALATSTVLPNYPNKAADVAFVVVAVNALSTVAMVLYPVLCTWAGLDERTTGILLGATIHDVAQVVGAGYSISDDVGNAAVIVKLFRVFLLLPVVIGIGWWLARAGGRQDEAKVPVPVFAIVFLALCVLNSVVPAISPVAALYESVRLALVEVSTWGLLIAIGALGLGTSVRAIVGLGWRHIATITGTTVVILVAAAALAGLFIGRV
jgi:uncharacterized integral membrane protein (TIGR00698 family)